MPTASQFRHQEISVAPRGSRIRTIHAGEHELRIAFPKGARKRGTGQLISILHPKQEKNPMCGGHLKSIEAEISRLQIPLEVTGNGFGRGFEEALVETDRKNPMEVGEYWEAFKAKLSRLIESAKDHPEAESNPLFGRKKSRAREEVGEARLITRHGGLFGFGGKGKDYWEYEIGGRTYQIRKGSKVRKIPVKPWYIDTATGAVSNPQKPSENFQARAKKNEFVKGSDGKTWMIQTFEKGDAWVAEAYRVTKGKVGRVAATARGESEAAAFDNLLGKIERNPAAFKTVSGTKVPREKFAYVGDPNLKATWKLPVDDYARSKDSLGRFSHTRLPEASRREVAERIAQAARSFGIDPSGFEAKHLKNPAKAKKNLDEIDEAAALAGKFKGSPSESVREVSTSLEKHRDDFAHLAWLYELVFNPAYDHAGLVPKDVASIFHDIYENDKTVNTSAEAWQKTAKHFNTVFLVFDFTGDEIELVSTARGEQLEFIGGSQSSFAQHLPIFKVRQKHDRDDLGDLVGITYLAKKEQFGDTSQRPYYHVFGEDGGTFPRAFFDELNKRIVITGGSYHMNEAELGIIN